VPAGVVLRGAVLLFVVGRGVGVVLSYNFVLLFCCERGVNVQGVGAMPWPSRLPTVQARLTGRPPEKYIQHRAGNSSISDVKLIRTDTTLDLSQKAEKGMPHVMPGRAI
jgi:hypothetical protein